MKSFYSYLFLDIVCSIFLTCANAKCFLTSSLKCFYMLYTNLSHNFLMDPHTRGPKLHVFFSRVAKAVMVYDFDYKDF